MDENELKNLLNKIGKRIFVQYFHEFGDLGIPPQDLVVLLQSEESFQPQATATRVTNARRIFHDGLEEKALSIISESVRVERKVADEASALLTQLSKRPV
jgi:hypothetical protein